MFSYLRFRVASGHSDQMDGLMEEDWCLVDLAEEPLMSAGVDIPGYIFCCTFPSYVNNIKTLSLVSHSYSVYFDKNPYLVI